MTPAATVTGTQASVSRAAPLVSICSAAALVSIFVHLLFLCFVSPIYLLDGPHSKSAALMLGHCFLFGAVPVFIAGFGVGSWAMHLRLERERQIDWPLWCIFAWALIGVGSIVAATVIEAGGVGYPLSDMVFAPLIARIAMQALLTFTLYSVTLVMAGFVFLIALERQLVSAVRD